MRDDKKQVTATMIEQDYVKVWAECLKVIKDCLGEENKAVFDRWFKPIVPLRLDGNTLIIQVPSQFFYEWIEEHYVDLLRRAVRLQLGPKGCLKYSIVMDQTIASRPIVTTLPSRQQKASKNPITDVYVNVNRDNSREIPNPFVIPGIQKTRIHSQLSANYTLENFVEGDCNRLARSAGYAVAEKPGQTSFNPLLLHGNVGLGKTHLANAIGLKTKEMHPDKTVLYVTSEQFMQQYAEAGRSNTINDFVHFYEMINVLIVDDIQFWAGKAQKTQEAFFHLFNHLHQHHNQIIITSDKAPSELQGLETRLLSRLKWGLNADLQTPDVETRKRILYQKLQNEGIVMSDDVIEYIAYNINTNVRELEGVLISLMAQSSLNRQEITLELTKQIIDKYVQSSVREITIDYIQKVVCDYLELPVESIQNTSRKREIVLARQLSMYFAKKITKSSLAVIGSQCGNKDHATVLHACKTIENLRQTDRQMRSKVDELEKKFRE
ncbi:MAG: chromosomal replication initiator protein DnaA [Bacteroidales bacterium]|nr:chromosomal replication initiator protein DnaA [Bacteroidales bacterium]